MKPNTFDVPAYHFALLKFDEEYTGDMAPFESYDNWAMKKISDAKVDFIPWENFDGLTIKEVIQLLGQMHSNLFFVGYTIYQSRYGMQSKIYLPMSLLNPPVDKRIDLYVDDSMMSHFGEFDDDQKRMANCFFERYQDRSHMDTLQRFS